MKYSVLQKTRLLLNTRWISILLPVPVKNLLNINEKGISPAERNNRRSVVHPAETKASRNFATTSRP
jgi:hypothetical protein